MSNINLVLFPSSELSVSVVHVEQRNERLVNGKNIQVQERKNGKLASK